MQPEGSHAVTACARPGATCAPLGARVRVGEHGGDGRVGDAVAAARGGRRRCRRRPSSARARARRRAGRRSCRAARARAAASAAARPGPAVGVLGEHRLRAPDAPGLHVEGPVLAGSRGSPRACPMAGLGARLQGGQAEFATAQHGDVVGRVEGDRARAARPGGGRRPPRSCPARRRRRGRWSRPRPARPPSRSPRSPARRRCRARARRCARPPARRARARCAGAGGATSGEGPVIEGSGSSRASALRIGPDGGSTSFSSRRIAERWMSARSCSWPGVWAGDGGDDPHDAEAERGAEQRAEQRRRAGPGPGDDRACGAAGTRPPPGRSPGSRRRAARRPGRRRGRRARRIPARAAEGPGGCRGTRPPANPPKESTPDDEALPEAEEREHGRERDNDPVQLRHPSCSTSSLTENHGHSACGARAP